MGHPTEHLRIDDLDHDGLAVLAREHLLAGHLIDRAGMPVVIPLGVDVMRDIAIDEWMAASPLYSKRTQRLLGFEGDTVETAMKGMQLDVGAPPEFMDFRYEVIDDHHGAFHLDHCGALMDVEPMGDDYVVAMCHHIEDPTFDATGWAANPKLRMHPVHRPPRVPADRHPHCSWLMVIDESVPPNPEPEPSIRLARTVAAQLPLAAIATTGPEADDGWSDYTAPLDPDLHLGRFSSAALRAIIEEVGLQGQLLSIGFALAVEARTDRVQARDALRRQLTGVAGVAASRLGRAFDLGDDATAVASVFALHPAFRPAAYADLRVSVHDQQVVLELADCPGATEVGVGSWISLLADGEADRALAAIAAGVDPHWTVRPDGVSRWLVERAVVPVDPFDEVTLTEFSTGARFTFAR